ncbi:MAG: hypothetical protein JXB07_11085 [Anaerolineae bacterium]|nr:hypothetical protein [Anaerolineae bacterium]
MDIEAIQITDVILVVGGCMAISFVCAVALLIVAARQVAQIEVPEDADFFETLQAVPITVPLALDLLDMAFDVFSAPISWVILELLGLRSLQMITVFEGLIPGTQIIPTLTIAWIVAKVMKKRGHQSPLRDALHDYQLQNQGQYGRLGSPRGALVDRYRQKALLPGDESSDDMMLEGEYDEMDGIPDYIDDEEDDF